MSIVAIVVVVQRQQYFSLSQERKSIDDKIVIRNIFFIVLEYLKVEMTGLEPAASTSRTWRATNCATSRLPNAKLQIAMKSLG